VLQQVFTFPVGSQSMNSMLMIPEQNTEATVFQHTGTLYILLLSIKMAVSTALNVILGEMANS
jgi:hypothetical protein